MNTSSSSSKRTVSFLNLKKLFEMYRDEFTAALEKVASEARFIGGTELETFERAFADWVLPNSYAAGCGNGTDAITLAARAFQLPAGSEAIIPAMTFVATAEGLINAGLKIKLVDVSPETWLMDPERLESVATSETRLVVPVHLYGQMAPMDRIREIADRHQWKVLEDSAQAHGAQWKEKPVGFWGDAATFSFFPGKNLGAFGDAGAVFSRDKKFVEYCSALAKHGGLKKYQHDFKGYNSRLDGIQAAILNIKLKYLKGWNEHRRSVAKMYREALSGTAGLQLPKEMAQAKHVYHLFVVLTNERDRLSAHLKERGIETGVHYPKAIHELPAFKEESFAKQPFPNAERLAKEGLSLPMCPTMTADDVAYVADSIRTYFRNGR